MTHYYRLNNKVIKAITEPNKKAVFLGWQQDGMGGAFPLFDVLTSNGEYPNGTTVGPLMLETFGIEVPDYPEYKGGTNEGEQSND